MIQNIICNQQCLVLKDNDNLLYGTGNNESGILGLSNKSQVNKLQHIPFSKQVNKIFPTNTATFITDFDGIIYATGYNSHGQLGMGHTNNLYGFVRIGMDIKINLANVFYGATFNILLSVDGHIYGAGNNQYGQLGLFNTNNVLIHTILPINNVKHIACSVQHMVVLCMDGCVRVAGNNQYGQCGIGQPVQTVNTFHTIGIMNAMNIHCGENFTCIHTNDNKVYGTGSNKMGQLGLGHQQDVYKFTQIEINNIRKIGCYQWGLVVLKNDGCICVSGYVKVNAFCPNTIFAHNFIKLNINNVTDIFVCNVIVALNNKLNIIGRYGHYNGRCSDSDSYFEFTDAPFNKNKIKCAYHGYNFIVFQDIDNNFTRYGYDVYTDFNVKLNKELYINNAHSMYNKNAMNSSVLQTLLESYGYTCYGLLVSLEDHERITGYEINPNDFINDGWRTCICSDDGALLYIELKEIFRKYNTTQKCEDILVKLCKIMKYGKSQCLRYLQLIPNYHSDKRNIITPTNIPPIQFNDSLKSQLYGIAIKKLELNDHNDYISVLTHDIIIEEDQLRHNLTNTYEIEINEIHNRNAIYNTYCTIIDKLTDKMQIQYLTVVNNKLQNTVSKYVTPIVYKEHINKLIIFENACRESIIDMMFDEYKPITHRYEQLLEYDKQRQELINRLVMERLNDFQFDSTEPSAPPL
jgi:alpha-tubulin suppressor-like RCC1 family protein